MDLQDGILCKKELYATLDLLLDNRYVYNYF